LNSTFLVPRQILRIIDLLVTTIEYLQNSRHHEVQKLFPSMTHLAEHRRRVRLGSKADTRVNIG
jgi:hypothetical protein